MSAANVNHGAIAIVLAAGGSRRMGRPKALLPLFGEPLVLHHVRALGARAQGVVVVTGGHREAVEGILPRHVRVVHNTAWSASWPADSLRLALDAVDATGPVWVTPVDTPPAPIALLDALAATPLPSVPAHGDATGHPVLLDDRTVAALRARVPDGGLRTLLGHATRVPWPDPWQVRDFDTPEAWRAFTTRSEGG